LTVFTDQSTFGNDPELNELCALAPTESLESIEPKLEVCSSARDGTAFARVADVPVLHLHSRIFRTFRS